MGFQNILGLAQEHIEITHEHVVLGNKQVITTLCNLTTKKIITKVTPTMMSIELFDGEVSLVKYVTELTKIDVGRNSILLEGNKIVQFNAYKPWFLPSEIKSYGKIALEHLNMNVMDYLNLNTMIPKITLEAKIHKDEQKVFHYLLTTLEAPCKVHIFFPYVFQNILSLAQEHIEFTHEHVVLGNKQVITTLCNLTTKKIITKVTPTLMSFELFDGEVSLLKYVTELTKIDVGKNSMLLEGNKIVQFNAYKPWFLPSEMKFYGKIALEHLNMNVIDYLHLNTMIPKITLEAMIHKDKQKVFPYLFQNILSMTQEHVEISHEHIVLGNKQVITTLCNLTTKKIITKVTPTMMSFELFDGEVSLVKYVTELTKVVVGRNSMLLEGNKIIQFNAYQPWFLPAILGFNQLKTKF